MSHRYIRIPGRKQPVKVVRITPAEVKANLDFYSSQSDRPSKVAPRPAPA